MKKYWDSHSAAVNEEGMTLDSQGKTLTQREVPEIMELLPEIKGDVLELGAGIGRFTGELATLAGKAGGKVTAVDFVESYIDKNRATHGPNHDNAKFVCADVTQGLDVENGSLNMIFSNWLLMYLSDDEVKSVATDWMRWLRHDGYLFFRESCFHQSGDKPRSKDNPTQYRNPAEYFKVFSELQIMCPEGKLWELELVYTRAVEAYVELKGNPNQICWLWRVHQVSESDPSFQRWLDEHQYTVNGILRYERMFGKGYVSTGGLETTQDIVPLLKVEAGQEVLDVGCGIGGGAEYIAENYGANVLGIDLSSNMINLALSRVACGAQTKAKVLFEVCDVTTREFPPESFDAAYSRDVILHIENKHDLFSRIFKWLRPGGRLVVTDYCCSDGEHSEEFKAYVKQRGYHLLSPAAYGKVLEDVGFTSVVAKDHTDEFVECLKRELRRMDDMKDDFIKEFTVDDYNAIAGGWKQKLVRCGEGDQRWGLFTAIKPLEP